MTEHLWLVYAVLSAVMAALVSIFGKIGLQGLDADTATVIRAVIMAFVFDSGDGCSAQFRTCRRNFGEPQSADFHHFERYGRRNVVAVLFCGAEVRTGFASGAGGQTQRGYCLVAAVVFLGESLSILSASGIALITVGIIMVALG